MEQRYLDLDLIVNGSMDAFLLVLTARLLNLSLPTKRLLLGILAGEVPVVFSAYLPGTLIFQLSKLLIPFLMIWISFPNLNGRKYMKCLLLFWVLSAGLGGFVYGLWGWLSFDGIIADSLRLGLKNLWLLPIITCLWWMGQKAWFKWIKSSAQLSTVLDELTIDLGAGPVQLKAMLDTGNHLRDPLTDDPVILVEEEIAATVMPEKLQFALNAPWKEYEDPWSWLWKLDPELMRHLVFIPYQAVGHKSWLLGVRPQKVVCLSQEQKELKATLALVKHRLSPDGAYQALLHSEHVNRAEG